MALPKSGQLALRNKARTELERLESLENDKETIEKVEAFKRKFSRCEIVYKILLKKQQEDTKKNLKGDLKIIITQVEPALSYAGLPFDENLMKKLFSSNRTSGSRTVKSLRDALTHEMPKNAVDELIKREAEVNGYMDAFLDLIRNFDSGQAQESADK